MKLSHSLTPALICCALAAPVLPGWAQNRSTAHALRLLHEMADAYRQLNTLDLTTRTYAIELPQPSKTTPLPALITSQLQGKATGRELRLKVERPNKLVFAVRNKDDGDASMWVCDGRRLWSYLPNTTIGSAHGNFYTRSHAPANLSELARMKDMPPGSLELMMMEGLDPFARLAAMVQSIRYEGEKTIAGVVTSIVELHSQANGQSVRIAFCIGKTDHLLYRMIVQERQLPAAANPALVGDRFDALVENSSPHANKTPAVPRPVMRITLDNRIRQPQYFGSDTFFFVIPKNAQRYTPINGSHVLTLGSAGIPNSAGHLYNFPFLKHRR